jgi:antitoxin component HigA of HigAB toxin-antitoxin module
MNIQPIRTEADYEAALAEVERLFDTAPDTPEGDRLDVLATLVEAYEEQHYSIPAPDPIGGHPVLYGESWALPPCPGALPGEPGSGGRSAKP